MLDNNDKTILSVPLNQEDLDWTSINSHRGGSDIADIGFFGNIFVRSHFLRKAGDTNGGGHFHYFDHVTLIVKGSVKVEVEGHEPTRFSAPRFVVISKDKKHLFTALEDDTIYYCVYALKDIDGEITDVFSEENSPYIGSYDSIEKRKIFESMIEQNKIKKQKLEQQTLLKD
jgi:hypothetical protein